MESDTALDLHRIEREIRDNLPVYVEALRQLVAIDSGSFSPEGVAMSHERKVWMRDPGDGRLRTSGRSLIGAAGVVTPARGGTPMLWVVPEDDAHQELALTPDEICRCSSECRRRASVSTCPCFAASGSGGRCEASWCPVIAVRSA
jgi:hypothetical protein